MRSKLLLSIAISSIFFSSYADQPSKINWAEASKEQVLQLLITEFSKQLTEAKSSKRPDIESCLTSLSTIQEGDAAFHSNNNNIRDQRFFEALEFYFKDRKAFRKSGDSYLKSPIFPLRFPAFIDKNNPDKFFSDLECPALIAGGMRLRVAYFNDLNKFSANLSDDKESLNNAFSVGSYMLHPLTKLSLVKKVSPSLSIPLLASLSSLLEYKKTNGDQYRNLLDYTSKQVIHNFSYSENPTSDFLGIFIADSISEHLRKKLSPALDNPDQLKGVLQLIADTKSILHRKIESKKDDLDSTADVQEIRENDFGINPEYSKAAAQSIDKLATNAKIMGFLKSSPKLSEKGTAIWPEYYSLLGELESSHFKITRPSLIAISTDVSAILNALEMPVNYKSAE